jgi:predicted O-methyltransferase YrrM
MTDDPSGAELISSFLLDLYGGDPFARVYRASNEHREAHGPDCDVYPSVPVKMRLLAGIVRTAGAHRILEIGCGLGYSALWLAEAAGPDGRVETIDRFPEHAALARRYAEEAGRAGRLNVIEGEGADVLATLTGPYDLIHDDGWFAREPVYFDRMLGLLRPGGLLLISNFFLLEQAVTGRTTMDWSEFAGPDWVESVKAYAKKLVSHPALHVSFIMSPSWVALAVKLQ